MKKDKPILYFVAGVTASGKSSFAFNWAKDNEAEILSCDSVAIYKGMDVGSAKPTLHERKIVTHHGLDLVQVSERYDVAKYIKYAENIVKSAYQKGRKVLVVGGSGFYLHSFFSPVVDNVNVNDGIKEFVETVERKKGLAGLVQELHKLNPDGLENIDESNPVRVIKSLERCLATGLTVHELKKEFESKPLPFSDFQKKTCLLDRSNDILFGMIERRTEKMIKSGLIDEVESLIDNGIMKNYPASTAVGYRETISFLRGEITKAELHKAITISTRQLVAKQRKWFRKFFTADQKLFLNDDSPFSIEKIDWGRET